VNECNTKVLPPQILKIRPVAISTRHCFVVSRNKALSFPFTKVFQSACLPKEAPFKICKHRFIAFPAVVTLE
jgi:hypothetical protein